jgi:hypothetical protein
MTLQTVLILVDEIFDIILLNLQLEILSILEIP